MPVITRQVLAQARDERGEAGDELLGREQHGHRAVSPRRLELQRDATVRPEAQAVVGNGRAKLSYQASFVTYTLSSTFDAQSVEDLVVGAHVLAAHGHARATKDPEVWAWGLHRACRTGPGSFGRGLGSGRHSLT